MARMTHADRNAPRITAPEGLLPPDVARRVDFSFSGLKTAVLRVVREHAGASPAGKAAPVDSSAPLSSQQVADISASFQRVVVTALLDRTFEAARWLGAQSVGIAGGVSANSRLRADAHARAARYGIPVFVPPLALSTDNAAMIGAAALRKLQTGAPGGYDFHADASLPLT
jgi:N6-L-threonylcarbamoyladenine synthase